MSDLGYANFVWDPRVNGLRTLVRVNEQSGEARLGLGFALSGLDVGDDFDDCNFYVAVAPSRKSFDP